LCLHKISKKPRYCFCVLASALPRSQTCHPELVSGTCQRTMQLLNPLKAAKHFLLISSVTPLREPFHFSSASS
jgi:hypothetical protein